MLICTAEAATILGVTPQCILNWVAAGRLTPLLVNGEPWRQRKRMYFAQEEVEHRNALIQRLHRLNRPNQKHEDWIS